MGIQWKSLASAIALGLGLLAFGPATSTAEADQIVVQRNFSPVGYHGHGYVHHYHPYPYRYGPRVSYAYPAPYPVVRVFVPLPFPHWVYRPAYAAPYSNYAPYAGAYRPY
jgi:hypothetical protein